MSQKLELSTVIGFGGQVPSGMHLHPSGSHLIYPLGSTMVIREVKSNKCQFLHGHNGAITCVAMSNSGRYIASGNSTHMGFKADVILWDFKTKTMVHRMSLHKVKVQCLSFSNDEKYLVSVGGQDDNNVTVWDLEVGKPICGAELSQLGLCATFFNHTNSLLVIGGKYLLKVWEVNFQDRKLTPHDCRLGQLKRVITSVAMDRDDKALYCGTTSGDVLYVQMTEPYNFKFSGPHAKISQGVLSVAISSDRNVMVGGGDGSVTLLKFDDLSKIKGTKLMGAVTSLSLGGDTFFCGTSQSVMYSVNRSSLSASLLSTCHSERINDVSYPRETSDIIVTCSVNDIRLWNIAQSKELLRIQVPNLECNCVCFSPSGKAIVSGWSDGKIRAFGPQTGKLLYVINDAHKIIGDKKISGKLVGVTALAMTNDGSFIISGGSDGQARVWSITKDNQKLAASMKEHKATINCIVVKKDNSECVTASDDGSCIIWNLQRYARQNIMYAQTYFKQVAYLNDESQLLTCGSDKQITYWDAFDCNAIRELPESETGEIHALDISPSGEYFVTAGLAKNVHLWHYDQGEIIKTGQGHSGNVTKIRFSPDSKFIASVGDEGGIFIWKHSAK
ncbi:flagella-associated protein 52 [Acrasis kona]|uniref:Cilia- and flagella-associated protein 52 n=1 Tax=Acrasis kona TaxID=1008807 RepID=A0AAW2YXD8_9EUKA